MEVAALTYQSQVTVSSAANSSQRQEHQYAQLVLQQNMMHKNLQQIIAQVNTLSFNAGKAGCSSSRFGGFTHTRGCFSLGEHGCGPPAYATGNFHATGGRDGFPQTGGPPPTTYQTNPSGGHTHRDPLPYRASQSMNPCCFVGTGGFGASSTCNVQPAFLNIVKCFSNWIICYLCGFDVADGHTSMSCPAHLHKALHDIYFTCQNV
jgi:hypothetical protein